MRRMLGAPFGGRRVGGQYGLESTALSLITPPNGGAGGGSCFPSIVVVALGERGVPVVWICALAEGATAMTAAASIPPRRICLADFIGVNLIVAAHPTRLSKRNLLCPRRTCIYDFRPICGVVSHPTRLPLQHACRDHFRPMPCAVPPCPRRS